MKIGIYFNDRNYRNRDCRHPELGNCGIGGTEYEVLLLIYALSAVDTMQLVVYHHQKDNLSKESILECLVKDENEVIMQAKAQQVELLITTTIQNPEWYQRIKEQRLDTIIWASNYLDYYGLWLQTELEENEYIRKVICVSRGMQDCYLQAKLREKLDWIDYMIPASAYPVRENYEPWVTYVGGLYEQKGFHILAVYWKHIVEIFPGAQLHVIGSGKLYDENSKLGKYQIADEEYENVIMPHLTDERGEILPSVIFHGNMGTEKNEIIKKTAVGVVNPTGDTETFCISAAEFSACKVPVVTKDVPGLYDTVKDRISGYLFQEKEYHEFVSYIIYLLRNEQKNREFGENGRHLVETEFSFEKNTKRWLEVIQEIMEEPQQAAEWPLVSVIIPTHNRKHLIKRSIDSVLNQTYPNIEIIIVDDNSNDGTKEYVVAEYGSLNNIQYIVNESNLGAGGARNEGVRYANGDYIAFQDSDDAWLADKLQRQMKKMLQTTEENVGMVYSQIRLNWSSGIKQELPSKMLEGNQKSGNMLVPLLMTPMISTQTMLIRKECFLQTGGFNESLRSIEDYEFSVRFAKKYKILFCDEPLVNVYETAGSVGKQNAAKVVTSCYMMKEFVEDYRKNHLQMSKMASVYVEAKRDGVLAVLDQCMEMLRDEKEYVDAYQTIKGMDKGEA